MNDKPKENRCTPVFWCSHEAKTPCVYFMEGERAVCKYMESYECCSKVAKVNRMTIEINKQMGAI